MTHKIEIFYIREKDVWQVVFSEGDKTAVRRYGSLKTMLGALEDYGSETEKTRRKSKV
jgi:hypothetical protein